MSVPTDDMRMVSVSALVSALRREYVPESTICRVLAAGLDVDDATARAYAEGRPPPPATDPEALHALLVKAQERRDWPEVVALIGRILEHEGDASRRARYFYTMAIIQRDELADPEAALTSLEEALDSDSSMHQAFERQRALLTAQQDWKRLERAHRKMIMRLRGQDKAALEADLFHALALIYRDRLGHDTAAIEAFKMVLVLRPDDPDIFAALQALGV